MSCCRLRRPLVWWAIVTLVAAITTLTGAIAAAAAAAASSSATSANNSNMKHSNNSNPKEQRIKVHEMAVDPFVRSSPLIAAMVCNDGIALVATHVDEPLQFDALVDNAVVSNDDTATPSDTLDDSPTSTATMRDLPLPSYNLRIMTLGRNGGGSSSSSAAGLMTAGWRADGHGRLLDSARTILARNVELFGTERIETLPYDLAMVLTMCAGSESLRRLSCAALLALPGDVTVRPCLWLVDETGATAVRALCLGGGYLTTSTSAVNDGSSTSTNNSTRNDTSTTTERRLSVSAAVQKELAKLLQTSRHSSPSALYFDMPATDGLAALIRIMNDNTGLGRSRMRLELAILPTSSVGTVETTGTGARLQRPTIAEILDRVQSTSGVTHTQKRSM